MKVAAFTVRATLAQSIAWNRVAQAHGHASTGTWIAEAVDRYLDALKKAGKPVPLAWSRFNRFTPTSTARPPKRAEFRVWLF